MFDSGTLVLLIALQASLAPVLVGLWDYVPINEGNSTAIPVHIAPSSASPLAARLDTEGILAGDDRTRWCRWSRDLDRMTAPRGCVYTESGYEIPALAVYEVRGDWVRIALDDNATRFGWVPAGDAFHPLHDLLGPDNLTYFTDVWDSAMYETPASPASRRSARNPGRPGSPNEERPYRTLEHAYREGRLWLRVELLDEVCGPQDPQVIDTGWVPARSEAGHQWAWFWSRGC